MENQIQKNIRINNDKKHLEKIFNNLINVFNYEIAKTFETGDNAICGWIKFIDGIEIEFEGVINPNNNKISKTTSWLRGSDN